MKKLFPLLMMAALWLLGCSPTPKNIEYGYDMCHYCKMTIVDAQHAAEAVTDKGKVYMFDAIECMVNFEAASTEMEFAFLLVNDYHQPKKLMDAQTSHYLISKNLPSPMGAFLTAFSEKSIAENMLKEKGGNIFNWAELKAHMEKEGLISYSE